MDMKTESDTRKDSSEGSVENVENVEIRFAEASHLPVQLKIGTNLAHGLDVRNSPILFGCRTGICGTCLIEVCASSEPLSPPGPLEQESLELYAEGNARARLACQLRAVTSMTIKKIEAV